MDITTTTTDTPSARAYTPGPPPRTIIEAQDIEGARPKDARHCPLARRLNREIAADPLPTDCGPLDGRPWRPYVEVFGGDPAEGEHPAGQGWVRYYHPALLCRYVYMHLDEPDAEVVRRYDETGAMEPGTAVRFRLADLARSMDCHVPGIPPDGLPLAVAARVLGRELDPDEDGETPDTVPHPTRCIDEDELADALSYPRYYCHCSPCILARQTGPYHELDSDYGEWGGEDVDAEGWDEGRMGSG